MEIVGKIFQGSDLDRMPEYDELILRRCTFSAGSIGALARTPEARLYVSKVIAERCRVDQVVVGPAVFEDVVVDGLGTSGHLWLPGCAFRRCVLRGKIGQLLIFAKANPTEPLTSARNSSFFRANNEYYRGADWALDISGAQFGDWDCRGVPVELIRINDETQIRVSYRAAAQFINSSDAAPETAAFRKYLGWCVEHREDTGMDFVLATHQGHKRYRERMELFDFLRGSGISM